MEEKIANYEAKESKEARAKEVVKAMEKHKIPAYLRDRLAKSISDDEDIEDAVSAYKQELITNGLDDEHSGGGLRRQVKSKLMKLLIACWNQ